MKNYLICICLIFSINAVAQEEKGDQLVANGDYKNALDFYQNLPLDQRPHFKIARLQVKLGNTQKAANSYQLGFANDSISVQPQFEFARLSLRTGDLVTSFNEFSRLVSTYPENPTYHFYLGNVQENLRNDTAALKSYTKAITLLPEYRAAQIDLTVLQIKTRRFHQAIKTASAVLRQNPDDIKMNSLIGQAYFGSRRFKKAIEHFEHLFALGNDTEYNRKHLAISYFQEGQWTNAIEHFHQFLEDYKDDKATVYFYLSQAYLRSGAPKKAQDFIERVIEAKTPNLDQEFLQLAAIYAGQEDWKNAYYATKRAAKEAPKNGMIAYQVAVAADNYLQDKNEVLTHYQTFVNNFPDSRYGELAEARISDLRKQLFLDGEN